MYGLLLLVLLASETIQSPVDFDTQVMPVLTKAGCNAGACHGSAAGRGEFRLSLYGTRPTEDYDEIVRVLEGRRINRSHPDDSLLLQKPTEQLSHEGGTRLDVDGNDFQIVRRWIEEGANRIQRRRLVGFQFEAAQDVVISIGDSVTLTAVATFDDGAHESVVPWTVFRPDDPSAVEVLESGIATVRRTGRHVIVARYLDRVAAVELIVPFAGTNKLAFRLSPVANASQSVSPDSVLSPNVDFFVDRKLQRLNISAAGCERIRNWLDDCIWICAEGYPRQKRFMCLLLPLPQISWNSLLIGCWPRPTISSSGRLDWLTRFESDQGLLRPITSGFANASPTTLLTT